ncbi:MAG: ABC transporter permease [Tannerella sp.]|jgi:hypothetical protein|nr:ABC transporter permease [Tannerella sp.]
MLRAIFTQLWNQKRLNLSVLAELLCVFGLVWYTVDYLFVYVYTLNLPNHRDLNHTWIVEFGVLSDDHPEYSAAENEPQALYDNFKRFVRTVAEHPDIEAVGVSSNGSLPASGTFYGQGFFLDDDTVKNVGGQTLSMDPETDFLKVFRHTRDNGKTPVSMRDFDWTQPDAIVISSSIEKAFLPQGGSAVGHSLRNFQKLKVVGVIDNVKRFDFQRPQRTFYTPLILTPKRDLMDWHYDTNISIRVRETVSDNVFIEKFKVEMSERLRIGNYYFKLLTPYSSISDEMAKSYGITTTVKIIVSLLLFMLLTILLCVFGTFWYRIHTRRSEIGLRKAMGATANSIRNSFFIEGMLLLTIGAVIAILIEIQLVAADVMETFAKDSEYPCLPDRVWIRFLITNSITYVILAVVVLISILIPAGRAATLQPSEALRDE